MNRKRISMDVVSGIYEIKNSRDNKRYIGSSKDIYGRWVQHQNALNDGKHHCSHLQYAWDKYGSQAFEFNIIEECAEEVLFDREQFWYDHFNCGDEQYGYNMSPVAKCPCFHATVESLKAGSHVITYEQFNEIIDLLMNTAISIPKIASIVGSPERTIYQIYFKSEYKQLIEDLHFKRRRIGGASILSESQVLEIIEKIQGGEPDVDIASCYGVSPHTIWDIRNHKCWNYLTDGIDFKDYKRKISKHGMKAIDVFTKDMEYLGHYESAREAERVTGVGYKMISQVCRGEERRKSAHGYIFKFAS